MESGSGSHNSGAAPARTPPIARIIRAHFSQAASDPRLHGSKRKPLTHPQNRRKHAGGKNNRKPHRGEAMHTEMLCPKERLASESSAQQRGKPRLSGAMDPEWAEMKQRLVRAERTVKATRRLTVGLFAVGIAAVTGVVIRPELRSAAFWTKGGGITRPLQLASSPGAILSPVQAAEAHPHPRVDSVRVQSSPVPPPPNDPAVPAQPEEGAAYTAADPGSTRPAPVAHPESGQPGITHPVVVSGSSSTAAAPRPGVLPPGSGPEHHRPEGMVVGSAGSASAPPADRSSGASSVRPDGSPDHRAQQPAAGQQLCQCHSGRRSRHIARYAGWRRSGSRVPIRWQSHRAWGYRGVRSTGYRSRHAWSGFRFRHPVYRYRHGRAARRLSLGSID